MFIETILDTGEIESIKKHIINLYALIQEVVGEEAVLKSIEDLKTSKDKEE